MKISLFVRNLLFAEKLIGAAVAAGHEVSLLDPGFPATGPGPDLLVLDLSEADWQQAVAWAHSQPARPRLLGFGPHVRADLFAAARAAGVDRSVANSRLADDPAGLMEAVARG
ncbi:MAG: hypothetical protein FJZ01_20860 [Candidatus Sericytochromatia bacterium]|nr:hypothetical protein [Candidatus Tanganyikabacteria bacterium]